MCSMLGQPVCCCKRWPGNQPIVKTCCDASKAMWTQLLMLLQVCRALAALEACNPVLLHRDVKPSNIFIDAAGAACLGDFGLARPLPSSKNTLTGETGTYLYMSPEMIRCVKQGTLAQSSHSSIAVYGNQRKNIWDQLSLLDR